jgi:Cu-Zn family superoxide dismutase
MASPISSSPLKSAFATLRIKTCSVLLALGASYVAYAATRSIEVDLKNSEGTKIGTATLTELKQGVKIELQAQGLTPGEHAFHIHENGECRIPDFKSAGSHLDPKSTKHGFDASGGPHAGDMPNLMVGPDGIGRVEVINTKVH